MIGRRPENHVDRVLDPAEELAHAATDEALWEESWAFDWVDDDVAIGGFTRVGVVPSERRARFWLHLLLPDGIVAVSEDDVPLPGRAPGARRSVHLRSDALWFDYVPEEPLRRWSLAVESFGLHFGSGREMLESDRGHRLPVGIDLEFEGLGGAWRLPTGDATGHDTLAGYEQVGRLQGELLIGRDTVAFEGWGTRRHDWGVRDRWSEPPIRASLCCPGATGSLRLAVGAELRAGSDAASGHAVTSGAAIAAPPGPVPAGSGLVWQGGSIHRVVRAGAQLDVDPDGWPLGVTLDIDHEPGGRLSVTGETVDCPVIRVRARDGRRSLILRPMMRFSSVVGGAPVAGGGFVDLAHPRAHS